MNRKVCFFTVSAFLLFVTSFTLSAQTMFPWPVKPFNQSHEITGTFCEFRDTGSYDHFHNGTDIPEIDGYPVYPVKNGTITSMSTSGSNAYVRVNDIAYVHIKPNPDLSVGDAVVAGQTVLGTIYPGLGHVHFTYGYLGSEKNAMLPNSGFTPLQDPWPPIIRYVHFYVNNSNNKFPTNRVSGAVDIVVKVDEQNGPPSSAISRRNNGIFRIGYKIFTADTSTVIEAPSSSGIRFEFKTKPSNQYVHNVFADQLSSTTSHVYIVTNKLQTDAFWNTTLLDSGRYVVMVFAEDTRGNTDTVYTSVVVTGEDALPPATPTWRFTGTSADGLHIAWYPVGDPDLKGYRFYFSRDLEQWSLHSKENAITAEMSDTTFAVQLSSAFYFRLSAVDDAYPVNESGFTDVYGSLAAEEGKRILIVDGFDRTQSSGSWHEPAHWFAALHGMALAANGFGFDCAANEALIDGSVRLEDYDAVFWLLGDESTADETFSSQEQQFVKSYLQAGGKLFVSGSEIAWDLDTDNGSSGSTAADEAFLHDFLKADYVADDANVLQVVGVQGSIFEGLQLDYGQHPYPEDYPDVIRTYGGSQAALVYKNTNQVAAIQYEGTFGQGNTSGKLVYLAFPFETIEGAESRNQLMERVLNFFFGTTGLKDDPLATVPSSLVLKPNYPNPFNGSTLIEFQLPEAGVVRLDIFSLTGQHVRTLVQNVLSAGTHKVRWQGRNDQGRTVSSGLYVCQLRFKNKVQTRKMLLLR